MSVEIDKKLLQQLKSAALEKEKLAEKKEKLHRFVVIKKRKSPRERRPR
jgi:hypothetical protein